MSNVNTYLGFYNLPAQTITVNTITAALVPAAGLYAGLPSPTLAAGKGLYIATGVDTVAGSMTLDAHMFTVRVAGKFFTGASSTFTTTLYQAPASIVAATTQATVGNDNIILASSASTAVSGSGSFWYEADLVWDSTSNRLGGVVESISNVVGGNTVYQARTVFTGVAV